MLLLEKFLDKNLYKWLCKLNLYAYLPDSPLLHGMARIHYEIWINNYANADALVHFYSLTPIDYPFPINNEDDDFIFKEDISLTASQTYIEKLILNFFINSNHNSKIKSYNNVDKFCDLSYDSNDENIFEISSNCEKSNFRLITFLKVLKVIITSRETLKAMFLVENYFYYKMASKTNAESVITFENFCKYVLEEKHDVEIFYEFSWNKFIIFWHKLKNSGKF